jgi:hypothetical protein
MSLTEFSSNLGSADCAWHEYHVSLGTVLAASFTANEWTTLDGLWRAQESYWQARCCECLGDAESVESLRIISAMLHSQYDGVAIVAISQLLDRGWVPTEQDIMRLEGLRKVGRRIDDIQALVEMGARRGS